MSGTIVTQRGFVAKYCSGFVESSKDTEADIMEQAKKTKPIVLQDKIFYYNLKITDVFNKFSADQRKLNDFEFREEILNAVLESFNDLSFFNWCQGQVCSKFLTALHKEFLNDTFLFIITGNHSISIETWLMLLDLKVANAVDHRARYELIQYFDSNASNPDTIVGTPKDNVKSFIYKEHNVIPPVLADAIAMWTSQPTGFKDLLIFAYIAFGMNDKVNIVNSRLY